MKSFTTRRFAVLEQLAGRARLVALLVLLAFTSLCWAWIVAMSRDMYGPMEGASAWMMTSAWDAGYLVLMWAMWAAMMAAMMLPSAAPTLLLFMRAARARPADEIAGHRVYALASGYLVVWGGFSMAATLLQWALASHALLSPLMASASPGVTAVILLLAGAYQLTPLKQACLRSCRSPLSFLMQQWQPGWAGAFRMGLHHGFWCLGCCWALMLLLFAGGVMHLGIILALTGWVLIEKLLPAGERLARASGAALIAAAAWMLVR